MDLRLPPPFPPPASIYTPLLGAPRVSLGLLTQTIRRYFWLPTVIVPSVWAATLFQRWNTQTHTWSRWAENNLCEPHGPPQTTRDPIHTGHTVGYIHNTASLYENTHVFMCLRWATAARRPPRTDPFGNDHRHTHVRYPCPSLIGHTVLWPLPGRKSTAGPDLDRCWMFND